MRLLSPLLLALIPTAVVGQDQDRLLADASKAMQRWIASPTEDRERMLDQTIGRMMAARQAGLKLLAERLKASSDPKRTDALLALIGHVGHRWLAKVEKTEMFYPGQYDDLKVLMPEIGAFYLELLLQTPEWFPYNERGKVIAPLRDLYPKGPDRVTLDRVLTMAQNELEPEALRVGLAQALAQWGNRKLIKVKIRALEKRSRSEDEETSILGLRELAQTYYDIRDYSVAAVTNREFISKAEAANYYLVPVHYYNAACCMCLSGDRRSALEYLRRCLVINDSPKIDSSMRLKRKLFERDPEIALVRKTKGFEAMLDRAFGKKSKEKKNKREER